MPAGDGERARPQRLRALHEPVDRSVSMTAWIVFAVYVGVGRRYLLAAVSRSRVHRAADHRALEANQPRRRVGREAGAGEAAMSGAWFRDALTDGDGKYEFVRGG